MVSEIESNKDCGTVFDPTPALSYLWSGPSPFLFVDQRFRAFLAQDVIPDLSASSHELRV